MRSKKILFILIPLIIIVLALGGGFAYLMLNSTPEKIFTTSINKVFDALKTEKEDMTTLKGKVSLTGSIESDDEEVKEINEVLEKSSMILDMAVDTEKMILNESIDYIHEDESVLSASILLQDEKGYVYLPTLLDKYLEIPEEEFEASGLKDLLNGSKTINKKQLLNAVQAELLNILSNQKFRQEKNGEIKASILDLSQDEFYTLYRDLCIKLKQNENFNNALGDYKEDIIGTLDDTIENLTDFEADEEKRILISIYTDGIFNKFAGLSLEGKKGTEILAGMKLTIADNIYKFSAYGENEGEQEEFLGVLIEDKKENKNKGTATITISADEEEYIIVYKYENIDNQTNFKATTEIDGVIFEVTGNTIKDGNNYKGRLGLAFEQEEVTININFDYNFAYGVEIQKTNIDESVLIDEMTEKDKEEMMSNIENASFLGIGAALTMNINKGLFEHAQQAAQSTQNALEQEEQLLGWQSPIISGYGYTLMYTMPENFELSSDSTILNKIYTDNEYNMVTLTIEPSNIDSYLKDLENSSILTSEAYKNQKLGEITDYETKGKAYKYRTITYGFGDTSFVNLYFTYELEDGYTYVVKVESEGGQVELEDINKFLDVDMVSTPNQMENALSGRVNISGIWYESVDDYFNDIPSENQNVNL